MLHPACILEQKESWGFFPMEHCVLDSFWVLGRVWVYLAFLCSGSIKSSPLCSHSRCASLWGWPALVKSLGSGQSSGERAAVPFVHAQLRGAELCQQMLCQAQTCQNSSGPEPKAMGYLAHHTLTCPGLYCGFVLGALRDLAGKSPSNAHKLCMNHIKLLLI